MIGNDLRYAGIEFLDKWKMQKLVRPVGVRIWSQHSSNHELSAREEITQHRHERYGATFTHVHNALAESSLRRFFQ